MPSSTPRVSETQLCSLSSDDWSESRLAQLKGCEHMLPLAVMSTTVNLCRLYPSLSLWSGNELGCVTGLNGRSMAEIMR